MAAKVKTFSYDDETDNDIIDWLNGYDNVSLVIKEALREKMERTAGGQTEIELLKKIWFKLQNLEVIPVNSSGNDGPSEEKLEHLSAALSALDNLF